MLKATLSDIKNLYAKLRGWESHEIFFRGWFAIENEGEMFHEDPYEDLEIREHLGLTEEDREISLLTVLKLAGPTFAAFALPAVEGYEKAKLQFAEYRARGLSSNWFGGRAQRWTDALVNWSHYSSKTKLSPAERERFQRAAWAFFYDRKTIIPFHNVQEFHRLCRLRGEYNVP